MLNNNRVVIITSTNEIKGLGLIKTKEDAVNSSSHSTILLNFLKKSYPKVEYFQKLPYDAFVYDLAYHCVRTGNVVLLNTTDNPKHLNCVLLLPNDYEEKKAIIQQVLLSFSQYHLIIMSNPHAVDYRPVFTETKGEYEEYALDTYARFINEEQNLKRKR